MTSNQDFNGKPLLVDVETIGKIVNDTERYAACLR